MNQDDISSQWQKLYDEFEKANASYKSAFSVSQAKFSATARAPSIETLIETEVSEVERTKKELKLVLERMSEFSKNHF